MKRISFIASAVLSMFLVLPYFTSVLASAQQLSTYQDPSGFFTISYPSNWIADPLDSGGIMFRAPQETFNDVYEINAALTVSVNSLPSLTGSLQDLTDYKLQIVAPAAEQTIIESKIRH